MYIVLLFIALPFYTLGQHGYDNVWVIGRDTFPNFEQGSAIIMDFNSGELIIGEVSTVDGFEMQVSNSVMCDKEGKLLFSSSGCEIYNNDFQVMENGESITLGLVEDLFCKNSSSSPISQGILSLPS